MFLLLAVLAPIGSNIKGHQAWFQLPGGFTLQPSELAKFGLIVFLAGYCNHYRGEIDAWRLTVIIGLVSVPIGLVLLQPDLGTVMVLAVIIVAILAVAGVSGKQLIVLGLLAITGVYAVVGLGLLKQYQIDRLTVFLDPESGTSQGTAYNQQQSTQTIAHGRTTGEGFLNGLADPGRLRARAAHRLHLHRRWARSSASSARRALLAALRPRRVAHLANRPAVAATSSARWSCVGVLAMFAFQIFENVGHDDGHHADHGIPLPFMSLRRLRAHRHLRRASASSLNVHMRRFT